MLTIPVVLLIGFVCGWFAKTAHFAYIRINRRKELQAQVNAAAERVFGSEED